MSLDALARAKGLRFGAAVGRQVREDPRFMDIVARECGVVVAENDHKWPQIHPAPDVFNFDRAAQLIDWADERRLETRFHNLVWHHERWLPRWINEYDFGANPHAEAERVLADHINMVTARYASRIQSWDVVNETVHQVTGEMRETVFTRAFGSREAPVDFMFHTARAALPDAELVYNDYMTWEAHAANHRVGALRFLEGIRARNVPVDTLGVQAHLGGGNTDSVQPFNSAQEAEWRRFMNEVTAMGFNILITEFDVNDKGLPADIATRDREVANYARAYLDLMLSYPQTKQVLTWGLVDHRSWLQGRWPRPDGLQMRPLPWDADYQPKPLYHAIADAFRAAPHR